MSFLNSGRKIVIIGILAVSIGGAVYTVGKINPTLLERSVGSVITPLQSFCYGVRDFVYGKADYFKGISQLQNENNELKDELLLARVETNRLQSVEKENKELYSLLNMKSYYTDYDVAGAKIIARDSSNWSSTFLIDLGSDDGIEKNMPVISSNGLVGKISQCSAGYSRVTTLMDSTDSISAQITRTNETAYITGDTSNNNLCKIKPKGDDFDILEGDEIITSNLSDIYPQGIMIGRVTSVPASDDESSEPYAYVEPAVDIDHIENVLVLRTKKNNTSSTGEVQTEQTTQIQTEEQTEKQTEKQKEKETKKDDIPAIALEPASENTDN